MRGISNTPAGATQQSTAYPDTYSRTNSTKSLLACVSAELRAIIMKRRKRHSGPSKSQTRLLCQANHHPSPQTAMLTSHHDPEGRRVMNSLRREVSHGADNGYARLSCWLSNDVAQARSVIQTLPLRTLVSASNRNAGAITCMDLDVRLERSSFV
jgi:hypothetical protein